MIRAESRGSPGVWPGAASCFSGRFLDRLGGGITEREKDGFGAASGWFAQLGQSATKGFHSKILIPGAPLHAIQKSGQVNQFAASVHEVERSEERRVGKECRSR